MKRKNLLGDRNEGTSTAMVISCPQKKTFPAKHISGEKQTVYKCPKSVSNKVGNCNDIESMCKVDLVR